MWLKINMHSEGNVLYLTCSQGCPSALPTLNLRLTDTCRRLLMRLTAGEKDAERIYLICFKKWSTGVTQWPTSRIPILRLHRRKIKGHLKWIKDVNELKNVNVKSSDREWRRFPSMFAWDLKKSGGSSVAKHTKKIFIVIPFKNKTSNLLE